MGTGVGEEIKIRDTEEFKYLGLMDDGNPDRRLGLSGLLGNMYTRAPDNEHFPIHK